MPEVINTFLWGRFLIILMLICGIYLSFKTKFLQFTKLGEIFKETIGSMFKRKKQKGISPYSAMSAALSGTMGTGNIIGVGIALAIGGAGALFWMWVSGFLCMIIKYAEIALAVIYREKDINGTWHGGPMYYIKNGLPKFYWLAVIFSICGAVAAFGVGNTAQISAVSSTFKTEFNLQPIAIGIIFALICAPVIFGSVKRLTTFTSILVPFMTLLYIVGSIIILYNNRQNILTAISLVFKQAFNFKSAGGGILGFFMSGAVIQGVAKGVFTNEAGMGSAPIVHAAADNTPKNQGYWGIFEVFTDTIIMCTISGLVILSSNSFLKGGQLYSFNLITNAFYEVFGKAGSAFVAIALALFAYGSIISWSFYGVRCLKFIDNSNLTLFLYKLFFCIAIITGSVYSAGIFFEISDLLNGLMAIPNLIALLLLGENLKKLK